MVKNKLKIIFILLIILNVLDFHSTSIAINEYGTEIEANSIARTFGESDFAWIYNISKALLPIYAILIYKLLNFLALRSKRIKEIELPKVLKSNYYLLLSIIFGLTMTVINNYYFILTQEFLISYPIGLVSSMLAFFFIGWSLG